MLTIGHLKSNEVDISYGSQVYIKDVPELVDISRELASPVPFCPWLKMRRARRNFEEKGAAVDRSGLLWMGTARVSSVGPEEWYRSHRNVKDQRPTFWRCLKPASVRRPVQTSCVRNYGLVRERLYRFLYFWLMQLGSLLDWPSRRM